MGSYQQAINKGKRLLTKIHSIPSLEEFGNSYLSNDNNESDFTEFRVDNNLYKYDVNIMDEENIDNINDSKVFINSGELKINFLDDNQIFQLNSRADSCFIPSGTRYRIYTKAPCRFIISVLERRETTTNKNSSEWNFLQQLH